MRKKYPKILTITPTYEFQKELLPDVLFNLANQDYPNFHSLILVNNSSQEYLYYVLREIRIATDKADRSPGNLFTVVDLGKLPMINDYKGSMCSAAINKGYEFAIQGKYDYLLIVVGDIALPEKAIQDMLKPFKKFKDCGISCLTCYFRFEGKDIDQISKVMMDKAPYMGDPGKIQIPMVIGKKDKITSREYTQKKYLKCRAGNGAMMIPRKVFEKLPWRLKRTRIFDNDFGADYTYCMETLEEFGLWTYINTQIYTPHLYLDKKEVRFY